VTFERAVLAYVDFKNPPGDDARFIRKLIAWFKLRDDKVAVKNIVGADLIAAAHALLPRAGNAHKNRSIITNGSAILHYAQEQGWAPERRFRRLEVSRKWNRRPASAETTQLLLANRLVQPFRRRGKVFPYNDRHTRSTTGWCRSGSACGSTTRPISEGVKNSVICRNLLVFEHLKWFNQS
jgi:hypothetical protein